MRNECTADEIIEFIKKGKKIAVITFQDDGVWDEIKYKDICPTVALPQIKELADRNLMLNALTIIESAKVDIMKDIIKNISKEERQPEIKKH